jgi:hypothetical protein
LEVDGEKESKKKRRRPNKAIKGRTLRQEVL